ncbi:MAG: restriction endonuclease subunit S [Cyanobacteria bacterium P01_A01_bin.68]
MRSQLDKLDSGNFETCKLIDFLPFKNGIRYGTSTPPSILEKSNNTVPFVRATDIKNGEILTDNLLHINKSQPRKMQKCLLREGEMIVVRSGVNTGDCATVPKSLAGSYGAYDLIVRFSNDVISSFVSTFLDTNIGRLQLNILKGRSAQSHLNSEEISSIIIPKPPIEIQKSLVAEIEAARQNRKQKLAKAEELLASIDSYLLNLSIQNFVFLSRPSPPSGVRG